MTDLLDSKLIPKYVNQLFIPPTFKPTIVKDPVTDKVQYHNYTISISEFEQQLLPSEFPKTLVWGYQGFVKDSITGASVYHNSTPGATIEAIRGIPINVQWINNLTGPHLFAVDPTLHWANPNKMEMPTPPYPPYPPGFLKAQSPVPIVTHLHGGSVRSDSDGGPESWFTAREEIKGPEFIKSRYTYPNEQEAATLWYHDHTLGITRLNIYAGLAGFYFIRDLNSKIEPLLPSGPYEIPLVIQDRSFNKDGSLFFHSNGVNPDIHPYWIQDFLGDVMLVNGRVWPNLNVEPRQYRFRVLNGSNARFYNLKLSNNQSYIVIGSDGGFLDAPLEVKELLIAPGERYDILIDFSKYRPRTKIKLTNDAVATYPNGNPPDPDTMGQIMQFTVIDSQVVPPTELPTKLNNIPKLIPNVTKRILTLNRVNGPNGPLALLLNGQRWESPTSELPIVGSTEEWIIANISKATHPIHVHLVEFQLLNRQKFDNERYQEEWTELNGESPLNHATIPLEVEPYLIGEPIAPRLYEQGWKDTIQANPREVTRIRMRFAPQNANPKEAIPGVNLYSFNPTGGPGYVWHCHLLDHEDNDMMRPLKVRSLPVSISYP